ncbi:MAG: SIMPL domain-containing protein [Acidimicrobiia bacterium]
MKSGITVTAIGQAFVPPDQAIINLAASVVRDDAGTAMAEVSRRVGGLLATLAQAGIEEINVQTSDLSLWPETDRNGALVGYRARNGVRISLADVSKTGEIVAGGLAALGEGAEMGGVSFGRREVDGVEAEARAIAWQKVTAKASQLADQAGLTLGRPLSIQESDIAGMPRPRLALAEAVPVEAGSTTVTVSLTVRFALVG